MKQTLFSTQKPLTLPKKLHWHFYEEPALIEWTIKARNYNTFVANLMFSAMALITSAATYAMYNVYEGMSQPARIASCVFFFALILSVLYATTHQTMKFAYRISSSGIEYCEWKNFPEWMATGFNWFGGVMTFVCLSLTSVDPTFFIAALLIPLFTYFSAINSKAYREMQTQYHHSSFQWGRITQVAVATNREVVDIRYRYTAEGATSTSEWNFNIFCQRKQKDHVASVLKPYLLPGTPFIRAKVDVPLSTKRERRRTETEHT